MSSDNSQLTFAHIVLLRYRARFSFGYTMTNMFVEERTLAIHYIFVFTFDHENALDSVKSVCIVQNEPHILPFINRVISSEDSLLSCEANY